MVKVIQAPIDRFLRRISLRELLRFVLLLSGLIWLLSRSIRNLDYNWQWYRIPTYLFSIDGGELIAGPLLKGLAVTFQITGISLLLALATGLTAATMRLSQSPLARGTARLYIELVRNTPLLVQIFFVYFVLSPILDMNALISAVTALSLFEGAYISEIFRAGILAVPRSQWEAADSLGMNAPQTLRCVVLPQALRHVLPPLTGQAVTLIKDSALVSTIAIYDLSMQGRALIAETYLVFEIWFTVAAIYLAVTLVLSLGASALERRLRSVSPLISTRQGKT